MIRNSQQIVALIGGIYDAAFDTSLWPQTLINVADALGGTQVMMGIHDFPAGSIRVLAPRMDPDHMRGYMDHWGAADILWKRTNSVPVGTVLHAERFVERGELLHTEIYNEWYRPMGLGAAGLGVNLPAEHGVPAVCGIKRSARNDVFDDDEIGVFEMLVPHLIRATQIHRRVWNLRLKEALVGANIDTVTESVIVVDARGGILFMSESAEQLTRPGEGLRVAGGVFSTSDRQAADFLERLICECAVPPTVNGPGGTVKIKRMGRCPLLAVVAPFPSRGQFESADWDVVARPIATILIRDIGKERENRKRQLRNRFQLTVTEADFALEIIKGDGREAAARRLGMAAGTARIHLQRIFDKTRVHRQAELVRLITDLAD